MADKIIIIERTVNGIKIREYNKISDYINGRQLESLDRDEDGYYHFKHYKDLNIRFRVITGNEMDVYDLCINIEYGIVRKNE